MIKARLPIEAVLQLRKKAIIPDRRGKILKKIASKEIQRAK